MKRLGRLGVVALVAMTIGVAWAAVVPFNIDNSARWSKGGIWIGTTSTETAVQAHRQAKRYGGSATIDFTSAYSGVQLSSAITVTGAAAGDGCTVGVPTAAAALKAKFGCYVSATDAVKVWFSPEDYSDGTAALVSGTPSTQTATVTASSICTVSPLGTTAAIAAGGIAWSVTTTTATFTGPNTVTTSFAYHCMAPVDPASGTFTIALTRNGT